MWAAQRKPGVAGAAVGSRESGKVDSSPHPPLRAGPPGLEVNDSFALPFWLHLLMLRPLGRFCVPGSQALWMSGLIQEKNSQTVISFFKLLDSSQTTTQIQVSGLEARGVPNWPVMTSQHEWPGPCDELKWPQEWVWSSFPRVYARTHTTKDPHPDFLSLPVFLLSNLFLFLTSCLQPLWPRWVSKWPTWPLARVLWYRKPCAQLRDRDAVATWLAIRKGVLRSPALHERLGVDCARSV